jgi:HEAT repeat protein
MQFRLSLLSSSDARVQGWAAKALWSITWHIPAASVAVDADAIPLLVRLLSSNDNGVLFAACGALSAIILHLEVARAAASTVNAIPLLISLLHSSDAKVQVQAAKALGDLSKHLPAARAAVDANVIPSLTRLLSSSNHRVVTAACETLAKY